MKTELQRAARALGVPRSALGVSAAEDARLVAEAAEAAEAKAKPRDRSRYRSISYSTDTHLVTEHPDVGDGSSVSADLAWKVRCAKPLECGSKCILARGHEVPCECAGDDPGSPGSCQA